MSGPRVVFGVPLYNGSAHLPEAIESLMAQEYQDFGLVMVDDTSIDATPELAELYRQRDPRIHFERNERRLGMVRNWRKAFLRARELYPSMEYFAWASDHDMWHPRWLDLMVKALDSNPEAVIAHPMALGVADNGEVLHRPKPFDSVGLSSRRARMRTTWHGMPAGYMVYSLFRADALERCGIYHRVIEPDRQLLFELSAYGECVQVPEILWYRRRDHVKPTRQRQMVAFFPDGRPLWSLLPVPVLHGAVTFRSLVIRGAGLPDVSRAQGAALSLWIVRLGFGLEVRRRLRLRRGAKVVRRAVLKGRARSARLPRVWRKLRRRLDRRFTVAVSRSPWIPGPVRAKAKGRRSRLRRDLKL